ncbi:MAG: hypothetical protein LBT00_02295 [Spirochaetaceae bacterium]|nr:hypothetical protein [Spirochaetaceae bacterium]
MSSAGRLRGLAYNPQHKARTQDCFAPLAMTRRVVSLRGGGNLPLVKQSSVAAIVIARSEATKQSSRGACSLDCRATLAMTGGPLAMTGGDGRNGGPSSLRGAWRASSLRGAKRRSNLEGRAPRLPRYARNDGWPARNDGWIKSVKIRVRLRLNALSFTVIP